MKIFAAAIATVGLGLGLYSCSSGANKTETQPENDLYMFTSFHRTSRRRFALLYSEDGTSLGQYRRHMAQSEIGMNIMRDPSIVVGPDSTYHLCGQLRGRVIQDSVTQAPRILSIGASSVDSGNGFDCIYPESVGARTFL